MTARRDLASRTIFVDASAFVAVSVRNDDHHTDASAVFERLAYERWYTVTILLLVAEAHALILREMGRVVARTFLARVYGSTSTVLAPVTAEDERQGLVILDRHRDKDFSFADSVAFAVCERLGITYAFSYDRHFQQYGRLHVVSRPDAW